MAKALNIGAQARGPAEFVPDELISVRGGYPTCEPMPAFRYAHSAARWRVVNGKVVPDLSRIPLSPGCQHVENRRDGKIDTSRQRSTLQDRDFTLIDYKAGPGGRSYVVSFDTKHKNAVSTSYCSIFETPIIGSPKLRLDSKALVTWLGGLITSGLIAPPDAQLLEARAVETRERLASAQSKVATGQGALSLLVESLKVELAAWEQALADLPETPTSTLYADLDEDEGSEPEPDSKPSRKRA